MKVKELIEKLKELDENMQVVVQFRDSGGDYIGEDDTIYLTIDKSENKLIL